MKWSDSEHQLVIVFIDFIIDGRVEVISVCILSLFLMRYAHLQECLEVWEKLGACKLMMQWLHA